MALREQDREWVRLTSRELVFEVTKEVIKSHIEKCPHGRAILMSKWFLIGICTGPGLLGGGAGFLLAKLFAGL